MPEHCKPQFVSRYRKSDMKPQYLHEHLESVANLAGRFAGKVGPALQVPSSASATTSEREDFRGLSISILKTVY